METKWKTLMCMHWSELYNHSHWCVKKIHYYIFSKSILGDLYKDGMNIVYQILSHTTQWQPDRHVLDIFQIGFTIWSPKYHCISMQNAIWWRKQWTASVSIVTRLWAGQPGFDSQQGRIFLVTTTSRLALGPIQPPVQWVLGFFPGG
jgi:hypothetical protein